MRTCVRARHVAPDLSVFIVTSGCDPGGPANGGLRLLPYRSDGAALADARRLAALMEQKHSLYGTGFSGGKVVARAADPRGLKQRVLQVTALLLESLGGSMVTGCDLNTGREDMERLVRWTPHVLAAVGSRIDPSACTAHGVLGALAAVRSRPGSALVHGCGAVGGVVARSLVEAGWRVWTVDRDGRRAALPGARPLDPEGAWWRQEVDVLLPCSESGLIGAAIARQLRAGAIVPAANAPFQGASMAKDLVRRGVTVLPDPLVNAGAVIADSIERYAPDAWRRAEPEQVYGFVRAVVEERTRRHLGGPPLEPGAAPQTAPATDADPPARGESVMETAPIGLRFPLWCARR